MSGYIDICVENFSYSNVKKWTSSFTHKQKVELYVYCAELVIDLYTDTSEAPRKAIQAAKDWILNPSESNRIKCKSCASLAYAAASQVTSKAAYAAVYAASFAADSSAYEAASVSYAADAKESIKEKIISYILGEIAKKLRKERDELLRELCDIQGMCIGEITMGYKLDADSIGCGISKATGMTHPELLTKLNKTEE